MEGFRFESKYDWNSCCIKKDYKIHITVKYLNFSFKKAEHHCPALCYFSVNTIIFTISICYSYSELVLEYF